MPVRRTACQLHPNQLDSSIRVFGIKLNCLLQRRFGSA
jgi:hypothetical protein